MRIVVCGAGTAGCIAAARLSEDPEVEVTLIEAGPHYRRGAWPQELAHSHRIIKETHDWGYQARAGASPRMVHVPRGRVVGGSSITNGAIALRGHPEHYDEWDDYVDGYGWETWLPWFCALERDADFGDRSYHGDHGPIAITRYPRSDWFPIFERFAEAALAQGHAWIDDHNEPGAIGLGPIPLNMIDGRRETPVDRYLDPVLDGRSNLELRCRPTRRSRRTRSQSRSGGHQRRQRRRASPRCRSRHPRARDVRDPGGAAALGHRATRGAVAP